MNPSQYVIVVLMCLMSLPNLLQAQEYVTYSTGTVERESTGVQLGLGGFNIYEEIRLSPSITVRLEGGLVATYIGGSLVEDEFSISPMVTVSPRWYHNLRRRHRLGKATANNVGNFFELFTPYRFDRSLYGEGEFHPDSYVAIIPSYGFRRNLGMDFNYEIAAGYGPGYTLDKGFQPDKFGWIPSVRLRLGFNF